MVGFVLKIEFHQAERRVLFQEDVLRSGRFCVSPSGFLIMPLCVQVFSKVERGFGTSPERRRVAVQHIAQRLGR